MKRILFILIVLLAISTISTAAFAAGHTMSVLTDKTVYNVNEEINLSVVVTLGSGEELSAVFSVVNFDPGAFSVESSSRQAKPVAGIGTVAVNDTLPSDAVGARAMSLFNNVVVPAGSYTTFEAKFKALQPGVYTFSLPEGPDTPASGRISALLKTVGPSSTLVPSTKNSVTITIVGGIAPVANTTASPMISEQPILP